MLPVAEGLGKYIQGTVAKLGIFLYNNKWLYYKTSLILILKK